MTWDVMETVTQVLLVIWQFNFVVNLYMTFRLHWKTKIKKSLKQSSENEFIHPWLFFLFVDLALYLCCCRNSKHKWSKTYPTHSALLTVQHATENRKAFNHRERSGKVESTYYELFQHLWLETKSVSLGSSGQVLNPTQMILFWPLCSFLIGGEFCGRMQAQGEHACVMGMM